MQRKMSIEDIDVDGKTILLRVDFNVPLSGGEVVDDTRIRAALPTINYLLERKARLVVATHLGRPGGSYVKELKLNPVADRLAMLLDRPVRKADDVAGPGAKALIGQLGDGDLILLENLRFEQGEEENDPRFAALLAESIDIYVNDAFGTAHRAHASTSGVAAHIPAVAGLLMKNEIETLSRCLEDPSRPLVAILGGAKVSDKINVIRRFLELTDSLLIGGGMANTFLAARGFDLKKSYYEKELVGEAKAILEESENCRCKIILPVDLVVTASLKEGSSSKTVKAQDIEDGMMAVDVGAQTAGLFCEQVAAAKMIVWNGPLGVFEISPFGRGTEIVAQAVASGKAFSVAGGGDLVAALESLGLSREFSFISTGGGATLEFWEGKELPGITALNDRQS